MRRSAFLSLDTDLADAIAAQQHTVLGQFDVPVFLLPRPPCNPEGRVASSTATFRRQLHRSLRVCDIRDEHGRRSASHRTSDGTPSAPG